MATVVAASAVADRGGDDDGRDWPMYGHDARGTRSAVEDRLTRANVGRLAIEWTYPTAGVVNATPAVVGGTIYAGDTSGAFYALTSGGALIWKQQLSSAITASALVTDDRIVIGDQSGTIYGLDRDSGRVRWHVQPNPHPFAAIYSSATPVGRFVAIGIASNEEDAPLIVPGYPCCTFRGSLVLLDPDDGRVVWQTFTISDADYARGASGAGVWTTPAYDDELKLLYVGTGNNYTTATTATSDALFAIDARDGHVVWKNQRYPDDSWNLLYLGDPAHPDYDFGDSPQLYRLADGRKVIGAGQKSGFYHVLDAATGSVVHQLQVDPGSSLGGLFADSAVHGGVVFANALDWNIFATDLPTSADLVAIAGDGSRELWRFSVPGTNMSSGVAVAGGVVYVQSELDGNLYALDERNGALLAKIAIGPAISGPAISRGHVYLGTGDDLIGDPTSPHGIVSLGAR
jgi:polyvinyl alcohol dehydrogenase (cytochrome)